MKKNIKNIDTGFEFGKLRQSLATYVLPLEKHFGAIENVKNIVDLVKAHYDSRPVGVSQQFSPGDLCVLEYVIQALKPTTVVELGVASGFTTSFILNSLDRNADHKLWTVASYDIAEYCAEDADDRRRIGFCVDLLAPHLKSRWSLKTGKTSLDMVAEPGSFPRDALAIVDANHFHPWPLIDVLALSRIMPKGCWILVQDIDHHRRMFGDAFRLNSDPVEGSYGPSLIYSSWPGRKVRGIGGCFNVGLIRNVEHSRIQRRMRDLLEYPFEMKLDAAANSFLENELREL